MRLEKPKIYFDMLEKYNKLNNIKKTSIKNFLTEKYNFKSQ